jgi:D-threonate/D-erythronate kinase
MDDGKRSAPEGHDRVILSVARASGTGRVDVAIIADDLTGAADSGVQLVRSGYRTAVVFRGAPIPTGNDLDAVAVDTDSRSLPAGFAAKRVVEVGHAVREARIAYKKIDSTLRGPIGAELAAALGATRRSKVVVAPAFPSAGRETRGGTQLVHGEPVHETGLSKDPVTPVLESHIPSLLAHAFGNVVALPVTDVRSGEPVRDALESNDCVVADAESDADLEALVRAVPGPSSILWAGSAGLARALGEVYPGARNDVPPGASAPVSGALAVVGSVNEVAREQLRRLSKEPGVATVYLDTAALLSGSYEDTIDEAAEAVRVALSSDRGAALCSAAGEEVDSALRGESISRNEVSERVSDALAEIVAGLSGENLFDALILTGGDTAMRVARSLGATGILLEGEIESGVPVGTLVGPRPYRVVTKAGGFGGPDTLRDAFRGLAEPRENGEP